MSPRRTKLKEAMLGLVQVNCDPRKKLDWLRLPMRPAIPQDNFRCIKFLLVALGKAAIVAQPCGRPVLLTQ